MGENYDVHVQRVLLGKGSQINDTWAEPGEVTLIYVRESTGSRKKIKTRFDGLCITIPREGSALVKEGWKLERTIPPQHTVELGPEDEI